MKTTFTLFLTLILLLGAGCTNTDNWDAEKSAEKATARENRDQNEGERNSSDGELGDALSELGNAFEEMGKAIGKESSVEPVDFRELREVLPDGIRGMEKGKSNGERTGALGFRISQVDQTYEEESGDGKLDISIVDMGGLKSLAATGLDWLNLDVDKENDNGFERTRTYRDHPVFEKCERTGQYDRCEMTAFVSRRFVVSLKSQGLEMGRLEDIMEELDIRKLEQMKDDGVEKN